jgi:hypothetical protein
MTRARLPYDPERAFADVLAAERTLERQIDAWGVIGEPVSPVHQQTLRLRLEALKARRQEQYRQACIWQMRFSSRLGMVLLWSGHLPKGCIP